MSTDKASVNNAEVSPDSPVIDVCKYGFVLSKNRYGVLFYTKEVKDFLINVMDCFGSYTIDYVLHDNRIYVANRYKVEKQEQFDFLLCNGRIGWLFTGETMWCRQ